MKKVARRLLSCMLALALVVCSLISGVSFAEAKTVSKDTTWDFYEVSYLNYLNAGNRPFSFTRCSKAVADKFKVYSELKINEGMTFYTLDGLWCLTGNSNSNSFEIKSLSYQGTELEASIDIPDFIRFNYVSKVETVEQEKTEGDDSKKEDLCDVSTSLTECTVTSIGNAFTMDNDKSTCTSLNVSVPKRVTTINGRAFYNNTRLTSVSFEGDIQSIGSSAFEGCTRLKTLDLAGVFETVATNTIPDRCFYKCSSLENIVIPETILNIGSEAFFQCNKIDYLVLKDSIKTIGNNAFAMCSNLRYLYIESNYSDWTNVVDKTEQYKLITKPVKEEPLLSKKGDTAPLGDFIYSATDVSITSKVDIDLKSVTVLRDGAVVPALTYTNNMYGYNTNAVYFKIGANDKGVYTIKAKDILGNTLDKKVSYLASVDDKVPPVVEIEGKGSLDWYQSAKIKVHDNETYVSSITLDGKAVTVVSGGAIECTEEGKHSLVVKDAFGNTTTKEFGIDKTAPVVEGVENNGQYSSAVTVKITEEGSGICDILLDGEDIESSNTVNIFETGVHVLLVSDTALNQVEYRFTIDTVGPTIKDLYDNKDYSHDIVCDVESVCGLKSIEVSYRALDDSQKTYYINAGDTLTNEGEYSVNLTDVLGKSTRYNFKIDKTAPKITGVSNGKYYKKDIEINVEEKNFYKATLNGRESSSSLRISEDGRYVYEVSDTAGNTTKVSFVRDTTKPTLLSVKNKGKYRGSFNLIAKDNIEIKSIKLNNKVVKNGYKIKKSGKYKAVVTDKAGNKSTYNFTVDVKAPTVNIKNGSTYKKVAINVKDDFSGVAVIKLDGKKVSNKTVVSSRGTHVLVAIDKYGNKTTVSFKIK